MRSKSNAFCNELSAFLLRAVLIIIGTLNIWLVLSDMQHIMDTVGVDDTWYNVAVIGYDGVMIVNIFLIFGAVLDWSLLVAAWIIVYGFIIVICSAKYVVTGVFPWTPGVSYTASCLIVDGIEVVDGLRPSVAIMFTLANFLIVFLVFLMTSVLDFKKTISKINDMHGKSSIIRNRRLNRDSNNSPRGFVDSPPPSYSEVV